MGQFLEPVSAEKRIAVLKTYDHTDKSFQESCISLCEWFEKQPHLPNPNDKMAKIGIFLVLSRGHVERAKQKADDYYTLWTRVPQIFAYVNPNKDIMKDYIENVVNCILMPKLTADSRRISIIQGADNDPAKFDLYKTFAVILALSELRSYEDYVVNNVIIVDLQRVTFGHVKKITPVMLKTVTVIARKLFGSKQTTIHILNHRPMIHEMVALLKTFMSPKVADRLILEESVESLQNRIGVEFLPADYGGAQPSIHEIKGRLIARFATMKDHFDHLDTLKVNESARPSPNRHDDLFGFDGNFRKLDVD